MNGYDDNSSFLSQEELPFPLFHSSVHSPEQQV